MKNNIDLAFKLIDGAIDEGTRRAINAADDVEVIKIHTKLQSLGVFMTADDKIEGLRDGAESVLSWERS